GCVLAPCDAGATTVVADRDSPSSAPRSEESDLPAASAKYAAHPGDPSSACVPAWLGSRPRRQSTARSSVPPAVARTSAHIHWLRSPHAPSFPVPRDRGRTSPLPRGAQAVALVAPQCPYPQMQFAESPGDSHNL